MICSLSSLYGRRVYLNMVAGGFKNDLTSMNDEANHDQRYERLAEYTEIIQLLLYESMPKTFTGKYYQIKNLWLSQQLPRELSPGIFMSGSSAGALKAARNLEATVVQYPLPDAPPPPEDLRSGWRIGIIARPTQQEAWQVARARFPEDRGGKFMHNMAVTVSDSSWYQQLSRVDVGEENGRNPYWLSPFKNYQTMCPYLVGSYECIAEEISRFFRKGSETFIFDIPETRDDLAHIAAVFAMARAKKANAM
jgi:alkanesulfonate monooxygenase